MKKRWIILIIAILVSCLICSIAIAVASIVYVLVPDESFLSSDDFENPVSIESFDGLELIAEVQMQEEETHKWAIMIHSYRTDHCFMSAYGKAYYEQGYNVLLPDNRAHGASEGNFIGMGYLDQFDVLAWVNYIVEIDPDAEIVLHGVSMGGATIMMLSGQDDLPDNIKVLVEDCGYVSATDYLTWKLKQRFHLPAFPVIPLANIGFKVAAGYWMNDASAINALENCELPILFIHGTEDTTVSVDNVYALYEAAAGEKEIYVVEGAGHGESMSTDPEGYWTTVWGFVEKYIK